MAHQKEAVNLSTRRNKKCQGEGIVKDRPVRRPYYQTGSRLLVSNVPAYLPAHLTQVKRPCTRETPPEKTATADLPACLNHSAQEAPPACLPAYLLGVLVSVFMLHRELWYRLRLYLYACMPACMICMPAASTGQMLRHQRWQHTASWFLRCTLNRTILHAIKQTSQLVLLRSHPTRDWPEANWGAYEGQ